MKRKDRIVLKTAGAMLVLLLFFFAQGAIVVITGIEGIPSALIRGAVIWGLVIITLANSIIRYKGISKLGFRSAEKGAAKRMLYFSPLLLIALSPFAAGINFNGGAALILANLFLTLGIGMAEEVFFRGHHLRPVAGARRGKGNDDLLRPVRAEPHSEHSWRRGIGGNSAPDLLRPGLRDGICPDLRGKRQPSPMRIAPRSA